ncbi:MAG: arsenite methyltransferase [Anaerolineales bacterium]|nr:arsenite methyltransferase [Anaerolineales bacterium]
MDDLKTDERIKEAVRQAYGGIASQFVEGTARASCCGPSQPASCCGPSEAAVESTGYAARFYSGEELADLPDTVTDISLGCGNPTAIAGLQPGEVVLDLGSGGGIDCFLAAQQVGPTGKVIGLDMTPEMIKLARRNARKMGMANVDFRYGEMEDIPLPNESVDAIISNCVINLSPDKDAVFAEAYRVLRPGGRMSVSDIVTNGELPEFIMNSEEAWCSCVSGALDETVYLNKIEAAGFTDVEVMNSRAYFDLDTPDVEEFLTGLAVPISLDELRASLKNKVVSIKVSAHKPQL